MDVKVLSEGELQSVKKTVDEELEHRSVVAQQEHDSSCAARYKEALGNEFHMRGKVDDSSLWYAFDEKFKKGDIKDPLWSDFYYDSDDQCIYTTIGHDKRRYKIAVEIDATIKIGHVTPLICIKQVEGE